MWTGDKGKKKKRSTRVRVIPNARKDGIIETKAQARARAQRIADKFEAAAKGKQTAAKLRATINELVPHSMALPSVRELLLRHLERSVAPSTHRNDACAINQFLRHLGSHADDSIDSLTVEDVQGFANSALMRVARTTVNRYLCSVGAAFTNAVRARLLGFSPFEGVALPKSVDRGRVHKDAFTVADFRVLFEHLPAEWYSLVLCSLLLGGLRLSDACLLRWDSFRDLRGLNPVHEVDTKKNHDEVLLPVVEPLRRHLLNRRRAGVYVHPNFAAMYLSGKESRISEMFVAYVKAYGLAESVKPDGRRNAMTKKSFHSIRYAVATILSVAGVDSLLVMRIQTHSVGNVHFGYVQPTAEQMRPALEKLAELVGLKS